MSDLALINMERQQTLMQIAENRQLFVLLIGGGVNGISTFRDLALQCLYLLLVASSPPRIAACLMDCAALAQ
jgi:hypothetical protein